MQVRDCMSTPPIAIAPDSMYLEALKITQAHGLHHLPVVDAQGALVGIVAERDMLLAATRYVQSAVDIAEFMHRDVITATPEMIMDEAVTLMLDHQIGCLPVADADRRLVGIITKSDIFKAFLGVLRERDEPKISQLGAE